MKLFNENTIKIRKNSKKLESKAYSFSVRKLENGIWYFVGNVLADTYEEAYNTHINNRYYYKRVKNKFYKINEELQGKELYKISDIDGDSVTVTKIN